jgi:hypothetical protein
MNPTKKTPKDPQLKLRYARGLGDVVACFLHSKLIGWLTKLITKKDKPCSRCSKRINALNVLLPFRAWKLFFKSEEEYIESLKKDLTECGYTHSFSADSRAYSISKVTRTPQTEELKETESEEDIKSKYILMATSDNYTADFYIKTQVYKAR